MVPGALEGIVMPPSTPLAIRLTRAFYSHALDLRSRREAPEPGWDAIPECIATQAIRSGGATGPEVRMFLTLVSALDRARDADRLWRAATRLFLGQRWAFVPGEICRVGEGRTREVLREFGVSQRHGPDANAWYRIARTLLDPSTAPMVHAAVVEGVGDTDALLSALADRDEQGRPRFPMLRGPKVSRMWIRMLVAPGGARLSGLDRVPVAVDVQVQKVTRYLGVLDVPGKPCGAVTRGAIQDAWREDVARGGAAGPPELVNTCSALDPAIWFFGKWGCTFCERARRRIPIADVCRGCLLRP